MITLIDEISGDGGHSFAQPLRRVAVIAVVRNPLVGRNDEDLAELVRDGGDLGRVLAERALKHIDRKQIKLIGKAAIIGTDGQPEHGQAILFPKFAAAVRDVLNASAARMFGEKKIASAGSPIVVEFQSIDGGLGAVGGSWEIRVPGAPRTDEILVALALAGTSDRA